MSGGPPVILVHGGAGHVPEDGVGPRRRGCAEAARAGHAVLRAGGEALDAVEAAVAALEDDPLFNAGTGAVLCRDGRVRLDAAVMDGSRLAAGAVAALERMPNPVRVARRVLDDGRHVLLVGEGALDFARAAGFTPCAAEKLIVAGQRQRWARRHGTVGAVALDRRGGLAAATSTGGRFDQLPGRVGDSPLVGCGTYADEHAAVSCTGIGEDIVRAVLGYRVAAAVVAGAGVAEAGGAALRAFAERTRGEAGVIVLDRHGALHHAHSAAAMPVAWIGADGALHTAA